MSEQTPGQAPGEELPPPRAGHAAGEPGPLPGSDAPAGSEPAWWDNPGLPWRHEPTRNDKLCMGAIAFMGVFGLAMLPLRGWLLGRSPWLLTVLTGSRSGTTALGALAREGLAHRWWLALLVGTLMSIKFDWIFWWAGRLWGRGMIEVWAGRSARSRRHYERAERWAQKFGWLGMFLAYVPIPLPLMQVIFVLAGAQGWSWRKFIGLDFLAAGLWLLGYFALGWAIGEPAVRVLTVYARYANYVAIGLVVLVVVSTVWNSRSSRNAAA